MAFSRASGAYSTCYKKEKCTYQNITNGPVQGIVHLESKGCTQGPNHFDSTTLEGVSDKKKIEIGLNKKIQGFVAGNDGLAKGGDWTGRRPYR